VTAHAARLDKIAASLRGRLASGFRASVAAIRAGIDRDQLILALARRDAAAAYRLVDAAVAAEPYRKLEDAMQAVMLRAGKHATMIVEEAVASARQGGANRHLDPLDTGDVAKRFSPFDPGTQRTVASWIGPLVTGLAQQTRTVAAGVIQRSLASGRAPALAAQLVLGSIGLSPRQQDSVERYLSALQNGDRAALRTALRNVQSDPTVAAAIAQQRPLAPAYVEARVADLQRRSEISRAGAVGDSEGQRAVNIAIDRAFSQAGEDGVIDVAATVKLWVNRHDPKVRHTHVEIPIISPNGVPMNAAFPVGDGRLIRHPHDPAADISLTANCRCHLDWRVALAA
jgi:hypothetical protein